MPTKPSLKFIQQAEAHLDERWAAARKNWGKADSFYDGTFDVWTDPDHQETRSEYKPTVGRDIVDHAVDNQMATDPSVHREPVGRGDGDSKLAKADADAIEVGIKASLNDSFAKEPMLPPKTIAKEFFLKGYANMEAPVIVPEPEEPEREADDSAEEWKAKKGAYEAEVANWNPFRIRVYNAARILLDPQERIPTFGIKRGYWYAKDLTRLYKKLRRKRIEAFWDEETEPFLRYKVADYWDMDWHIVIVSKASEASKNGTGAFSSGEVFLEERNPNGFVPFIHAFAGFGFEPTDGDKDDPQYMAQGLLHPAFLEALRIDAQQKTGVHNALMNAAFYKMGTTETGPAAREKAQGELIEGAAKSDWWTMDPPDLPAWMFQMMGIHAQDLRFGSYASILTGERPEGVTTVGATALLSTAAAQKFIVPGKQENFMFSHVGSNMLRWIDLSGKTVSVQGKKITPEMIRHNYAIDVLFELVNPVVHLQEKQQAMQEYQAKPMPLRSWESYQDIARNPNTTEEKMRIFYDIGMQHPMVQEIIAKAVLKGWGLKEIQEQIEEEARLQAGRPKEVGGGLVDSKGNPLLAAGPSPMNVPTANPPQPGSPREAAIATEQMREPIGAPQLTAAGVKPPQRVAVGRNGR